VQLSLDKKCGAKKCGGQCKNGGRGLEKKPYPNKATKFQCTHLTDNGLIDDLVQSISIWGTRTSGEMQVAQNWNSK
jgi:hypothetical protein